METGLLGEVNRQVLHPRGLALSVVLDEQTGLCTFAPELVDARQELDGIVFDGTGLVDSLEKVVAFDAANAQPARAAARRNAFGWIIQGAPALEPPPSPWQRVVRGVTTALVLLALLLAAASAIGLLVAFNTFAWGLILPG
ncbi:MAG: hypothetical protein ACTHU0_21980 [Kofleriaceae bacterium]